MSKKPAPPPYSAPTYGTAAPSSTKKDEKKNDNIYNYSSSSSAETGPIYSGGSIFHSFYGRLVMICLISVLVIMFLLAFVFCLIGAIKYKKPRYFALIINIVLSTVVTGVLIFWAYRGVLASSMVWYVFVQCTFLLFQFITTDIFAWYEQTGAIATPATSIAIPAYNCTHGHNNSHFNCTLR